MRRMVRLVHPLLLALIVASCGGSSTPTTGTTGGNTSSSISVGNNFFSPSATTVAVGTTVTWTWAQGDVQHNVTFDDGSGLQSAIQATGSYTRTFSAAGTYKYHCVVHGSAMSGTITVQ